LKSGELSVTYSRIGNFPWIFIPWPIPLLQCLVSGQFWRSACVLLHSHWKCSSIHFCSPWVPSSPLALTPGNGKPWELFILP
jgi:hypothetical protein